MGEARRPRVHVVQPVPDEALDELRALADVDVFDRTDRRATAEELRAAAATADYLFALGEQPIDAELLDACPSLRMIATMEIFPTALDLPAATARGVPVTGLPHHPEITETTAELTYALLCATAWRVAEADAFLRSGRWQQYQSVLLPATRLWDKRLGILGLGRVGQGVARRAQAAGMRVAYHDRRRLPAADERALGVDWSGLDALFAGSDAVVVCVALTEETVDLVDARRLALMPSHALLVNTSRGRVVDEAALAEALASGRLRGAGLDVYRREVPEPDPGPDPRLLDLPNVVLTPHIGTSARETRRWMAARVVAAIGEHLAGRRPPDLLNPEVYGDAPRRFERIG